MARSRRLEVVIAGDVKGALASMSAVDRRAGGLGGSFKAVGAAAVAGFAVVGAAAAGAGFALFKIGSDFDSAYDKIRVGTGATGGQLDKLKDSFRNVVRDVPASFGDASQAIADINTRLGLTGAPLEALSGQMLNLSRITDTDLTGNIESLTRVFGDWGVQADQMPDTMDRIFRASQATGAGVDTLAEQVVQFGAPLRNLGFSLDESVAMFGAFEQQGVNIQTLMPGLRQGLKNFAQAGRDPAQAFAEFSAGVADGSLTMTDAMEQFGARAGADMFTAMREGRFDMSALIDTISNGSDTINGASDDTESFGEKWTRVKNRVLLALEPVAMRVFDGMGQLMDDLAPKVSQLAAWFTEHLPPAMEAVRAKVDEVWPKVRAALDQVVGFVRENWPEIKRVITETVDSVVMGIRGFVDIVTTLWNNFGDNILDTIRRNFNPIIQVVSGVLEYVRGVITTVTSLISGDWSGVWEGLKQMFSGIWSAVIGIVQVALNTLRLWLGMGLEIIGSIWKSAWRGIKNVFTGVWNGIKSGVRSGIDAVKGVIRAGVAAVGSIWGGIKSAMAGPLNWVIDNVINRFLGVMRTVANVVNLGGLIPGNVPNVGTGGGGRRGGNYASTYYHSGGVVGETGGTRRSGPLRPGEVPAVLQTGETVVDRMGMVAGKPAADVIAQRYGVRTDDELRSMGYPIGGLPNPVSAIAGLAQDAVSFVNDRLRDLAAGGLARLLDPIRGAISDAGSRFGTPGKVFGGMVNKPIDALLLWVAGAANEADKRAAPTFDKPGHIWPEMFDAVKRQFPDVVLHSGFRPGAITATGNPSRHGMGRAIDISPRMDIFEWLSGSYPNSYELIFSPANGRQIHRGNRRTFGEPTRGDHWDHIHWSMANGGLVKGGRGGVMAHIGEGRHDELVTPLPSGGLGALGGDVNLTVNLTVTGSVVAQGDLLAEVEGALRRGFTAPELERLIRRTAN